MYHATKNSFLVLFLALVLEACGEPPEDLFPDSPDGGELGSVEQAMTTRFSPTYSHGVTTGATGLKCATALGPGTGQACMLPGIGMVKYMFGAFTPAYMLKVDVPNRARSFFNSSIRPDNWGQPMPFGNAVEVTSGANIVIQEGPCPGSSMDNNIWSFGCLSWQGGATTVTESLVGTYKRFTGVLYVNIDMAKIIERVALQPWGTGDFDTYELTEHALGATLPAIYGSGVYGHDVTYQFPVGTPSWHRTWSSRFVHNNTMGYEAGGYTIGEMCRMGYWNSQLTSTFAASNQGSCVDSY